MHQPLRAAKLQPQRLSTSPARAWYGSHTPPDEALLHQVEGFDPAPQILYDHTSGVPAGEYGELVKGLYAKMDTLKRNPTELRTWTQEDGLGTLMEVVVDLVPGALKGRIQVLQELGSFRFRRDTTPEEKRNLLQHLFAEPGETRDPRNRFRLQATRLATLWNPQPDTLLDFLIHRPAQVGRLLTERLKPTSARPLKLIGHVFAGVRRSLLQPLAEAKVVAYERTEEIHLVLPVRTVLEQWDQDAVFSGGCSQISLFETLLLHELAELLLQEFQPGLEPLNAHLIASTFERYLKGVALPLAVEDFFLNWPPLSAAEEEERRQLEMDQQLEEMRAFFQEEPVPQEQEEEVQNLPFDGSAFTGKKKTRQKK